MSTSSNVYKSQQLGGYSSSLQGKLVLDRIDDFAMDSNTNQQETNYAPSQSTRSTRHCGGPIIDYEQQSVPYFAMDSNTNQQEANYAHSQSTHSMRLYDGQRYEQQSVPYFAMDSNTNLQEANCDPSQSTHSKWLYGGPITDYKKQDTENLESNKVSPEGKRHVLTILVLCENTDVLFPFNMALCLKCIQEPS